MDRARSEKVLKALKKGRIVLSLQTTDPEKFGKRSRGKISLQQYFERLINFIKMADSLSEPVSTQIHFMTDASGKEWNIFKLLRKQKQLQKTCDRWCDILGYKNKRRINIFNPAASYPLGTHSTFYVNHSHNWDNQLIDDSFKVGPRKTGLRALMTDTLRFLPMAPAPIAAMIMKAIST